MRYQILIKQTSWTEHSALRFLKGRSCSFTDLAPGQPTDPDKRAFQQHSLGKENARQAKGKKPRRSTLTGGAPFVISASAQPPAFLQGSQNWLPQPPGIFSQSPPADVRASPSTAAASPLSAGVNGLHANGSGHLPLNLPGQLPQVQAPLSQQPQGNLSPLPNSSHVPGQSQALPPPSQEGAQSRSQNSPQPASSLPTTSSQSQELQPEGGMQSQVPVTDRSKSDSAKESLNSQQIHAAAQDVFGHFENEPKSPCHLRSALGSVSNPIEWPPVDSPGAEITMQLRSANKAVEPPKPAEFVTPTKASKSGRQASSQKQPSPLKSPHAGRKGTPRKRKMEDKDGPAPSKRVSPNRALFGGQPAPRQDKQPKKALFAEQREPAKSGSEGHVEGRMSDAGLLDHLELPEDGPMDEAEFRALVVDTFSKNLDVPTRIADHITQVLNGGGPGDEAGNL